MVDIHLTPGPFQHLGVRPVGQLGRLFDQLEHPAGAGQGVLQLGDHPGDLVKGFGVLVGIA